MNTVNDKLEERALKQFREYRDWLIKKLFDSVRNNPGLTLANAQTALNALADPFPTHQVVIRDRVGLLAHYVTEFGGWAATKARILALPDDILLQITPGSTKQVPTSAKHKLMRMIGDVEWKIPRAADAVHSITSRTSTGLVIEETWTSASLGYRVRRRRGWKTVPGPAREAYDHTVVVEEF